MSTIASQITSLTIVYSTVYSGADQSQHQSPASLAFVWGIHPGPVNSPHKLPVTRKMFPFDDVIMATDETCRICILRQLVLCFNVFFFHLTGELDILNPSVCIGGKFFTQMTWGDSKSILMKCTTGLMFLLMLFRNSYGIFNNSMITNS